MLDYVLQVELRAHSRPRIVGGWYATVRKPCLKVDTEAKARKVIEALGVQRNWNFVPVARFVWRDRNKYLANGKKRGWGVRFGWR